MARKRTLNRMDFRGDFDEEGGEAKKEVEEETDEEEEGEEEEEAEADEEAEEEAGAEDDEDAPKPVKKVKKKPAAPKRVRVPKVVRMKAVWVVYDNSSKLMETFPFNQKAEAETYLEHKNVDRKGLCFLQMVKVPYDEK